MTQKDEPGVFFIWSESKAGELAVFALGGRIDPGPYFTKFAAIQAAEASPHQGVYRIFKGASVHTVEIGPPSVVSSSADSN